MEEIMVVHKEELEWLSQQYVRVLKELEEIEKEMDLLKKELRVFA